MSQRETRSVTAELRVSASDDGRTIEGLIPYSSPSVDLGGFTEIIAPGAFAAALEEEADVRALLNHDSTLLLGRTKSGTLTLTDSPEGLRYRLKLPNTTAGNDLAEQVSRGDLEATSFGFCCHKETWAVADDGTAMRTLQEVELFEVSPTGDPAYPDASVALRSIPDEIRSRIEQSQKGEPTSAPEVVDEDLETLKLRIAIRSRK
jgi:HK97 family phage prohead protease